MSEDNFIQDACNELDLLLSKFDYNPINNLIAHVAKLCNVTTADLLSSQDKAHYAQARWLLWYAYRYATNETYEMIAKRMQYDGKTFCSRAIAAGVEKMSVLTEENEMWRNRWLVIKHLIKKSKTNINDKYDVTVYIPDEIKDKINVKIK